MWEKGRTALQVDGALGVADVRTLTRVSPFGPPPLPCSLMEKSLPPPPTRLISYTTYSIPANQSES